MTLPDLVADLIPEYLSQQRWYAGADKPANLAIERARQLWAADDDGPRLWQVIVDADAVRYQVLIGERDTTDRSDFLHGREEAVLGTVETTIYYDATLDTDLTKALLEVASKGEETAKLARPMKAEQSNTSLVFDDRLILKVFRRLHAGHNPDVEVTLALWSAGFEHVAEPLVTWREEPYDLAFGQQFLAGGLEGWALALTSLRDLYNSLAEDAREAGGDFAAESRRLGRMTAEMHLALAKSFGVDRGQAAIDAWSALLTRLDEGIAGASDIVRTENWDTLMEHLRTVDDPGPVIRVHGDYHLGQVIQTDTGWYVLDFEGEPARALEERTALTSPLKDVSSMLRSFDYAAMHALSERTPADIQPLTPLARSWETRNRQAFLEGYRETDGIESLLPDASCTPAVLMAFEVDKAIYELEYERAHRPEWVSIPVAAVHRLIEG